MEPDRKIGESRERRWDRGLSPDRLLQGPLTPAGTRAMPILQEESEVAMAGPDRRPLTMPGTAGNRAGRLAGRRGFLDLFCGAGGFTWGWARAGFVPVDA